MSKPSRFWDWLLHGLICLSPMGALGYYMAGAEMNAPNAETTRSAPAAQVAGGRIGAVIRLARQ
jgi:hypothetical protein